MFRVIPRTDAVRHCRKAQYLSHLVGTTAEENVADSQAKQYMSEIMYVVLTARQVAGRAAGR